MQGKDSLVHMENGCICCDLNEEFLAQVVGLAREGTVDYILVESTGVADPEPVAESLIEPSLTIGEAKDKLGDMVKLGMHPCLRVSMLHCDRATFSYFSQCFCHVLLRAHAPTTFTVIMCGVLSF